MVCLTKPGATLVKFPHSPILHYAFSSWIEKTMQKQYIALGKQICFTIGWDCAEILPPLSPLSTSRGVLNARVMMNIPAIL